MQELIRCKLREIEEKEQVKILHAVESGSRAWGFASPDSDYDVRFIYVRPLPFYLRLEDTRDCIDWALDETLDINGWDLSKVLRHFHKSNATLFEWAASPVVYTTTPLWRRIWETARPYFSCKAAMYHYYGTARKNYETYLTDNRRQSPKLPDAAHLVRYKKYFYVLRPLLACRWIEEKAAPPPVLFQTLTDAVLEEEMKPVVERLMQAKRQMTESESGRRIAVLDEYLENHIRYFEELAKQMADDRNPDWEALNKIFAAAL